MHPLFASPSELDRIGRLTLIGVTAAALGASVLMNEARPLAAENLGIFGVGAIFLTILVGIGDRLEALATAARVGYFTLQLLLAAFVFLLQARLGSFGMAWIILMPLLVQGMFVWSRRGMAALSFAVLALPVLHVLHLTGWRSAAEVAIGVGAGIVFVLLFSAATVREARARSESEQLSRDLFDANRRLAELAVHSAELASERERLRLAREIHDSVGHGLTVANVQIEAAGIHLHRDPDAVPSALAKAASAVRQSLAELRTSVGSLRAGPLENHDLAGALEDLRRQMDETGVSTELRVLGSPRTLPHDLSLTLFRVAQEGLTNVHKHASARRALMTLDYDEGERVVLEILNDGIGEAAKGVSRGFGLLGLEERVAIQGGRLEAGLLTSGQFSLRTVIPT